VLVGSCEVLLFSCLISCFVIHSTNEKGDPPIK